MTGRLTVSTFTSTFTSTFSFTWRHRRARSSRRRGSWRSRTPTLPPRLAGSPRRPGVRSTHCGASCATRRRLPFAPSVHTFCSHLLSTTSVHTRPFTPQLRDAQAAPPAPPAAQRAESARAPAAGAVGDSEEGQSLADELAEEMLALKFAHAKQVARRYTMMRRCDTAFCSRRLFALVFTPSRSSSCTWCCARR